MVLLTSSQVSVALSSAIVCFFTLALFVAGYVLQQQTVRSLQDAIKPKLPSPNANIAQTTHNILDPGAKGSRNVFSAKDGTGHREITVKETLVNVNWNKLAYLKLVKSHEELCGAVMLFAELARAKTPAQRVLIFPQHWALETSDGSDGKEEDPILYTTKRLLRKTARRYRTVLIPMSTMQSGMDETSAASYSLAPAFSLRDYDRVMLLPSSGVMIGATLLDSFLAFSQPSEAVSALVDGGDLLAAPLLIQPAKADYTALITQVRSSEIPNVDVDFLRIFFPAIPVVSALDETSTLYTTTSSLQVYPSNPGPASEFNATHFLHNTAFVRLQDDGLPGPEFDVPYAVRAKARPQNDQARKVWERMYEKFRAGRQDVCGLELEPWTPSVAGGDVEGEMVDEGKLDREL